MGKPKVLITGASGLIGGLVIEGLSEKYDFSALNRSKIEGIPLQPLKGLTLYYIYLLF